MEKDVLETEKENKVYELSLNLVPSLTEDTLASEFEGIKGKLSALGASFISEATPKMINLAYEMTKVIDNKTQRFNSAFFGWVKFEMKAEQLKTFENDLKLNINVIRFLIIKTDRENTMAPKKVLQGREGYSRNSNTGEPVKEEAVMDKEVVDKKIEELAI